MAESLLIPSTELKRTAEVASSLSRIATELLDLAEKADNAELSSALIAEAQQLIGASEELSQSIETTAAANASPAGLFGLAVSLGGKRKSERERLANALLRSA